MGRVETSSAELGPKLPNQLYNKKKNNNFFHNAKWNVQIIQIVVIILSFQLFHVTFRDLHHVSALAKNDRDLSTMQEKVSHRVTPMNRNYVDKLPLQTKTTVYQASGNLKEIEVPCGIDSTCNIRFKICRRKKMLRYTYMLCSIFLIL